ncbi:MAG TPA: FxsA family protein [Paracoccaceae bacterium]|nr:FxsA family protein [Paracoccaceae bacterium]HMO71265.1 FxsA family protein [Paracoccaceae bacterium]
MALIVAFIFVPLAEIALFVTLGGWLGLWPTLAWVVLSAVIGLAVLRVRGIATLRTAGSAPGDAGAALADGVLAVLGGALLMAPGFLTDAVGLLLLIPPLRRLLVARMGARIVMANGTWPRHATREDVIDGDWEVAERPTPQPGQDRIGRH